MLNSQQKAALQAVKLELRDAKNILKHLEKNGYCYPEKTEQLIAIVKKRIRLFQNLADSPILLIAWMKRYQRGLASTTPR